MVNGKKINCNNRKYCLECSPYGEHNTGRLHEGDPFGYAKDSDKQYICKCGETDPSKFYGNKKTVCGKCHNQYTLKKGQEKRKYAIEQLGGKCCCCGYDKYFGAIDIHHKDPLTKDEKFTQLRGWSKERIEKEIENCVALCKVCHAEVHAGIRNIK